MSARTLDPIEAARTGIFVDFTKRGVLDALKQREAEEKARAVERRVNLAKEGGFVDFSDPDVVAALREKWATESMFNENDSTAIGRAALSAILDHFPGMTVDRIVERDESHRSDYWLVGPDYYGGFDNTTLCILAGYILNDPDFVQDGRTPRDQMIQHYLKNSRRYNLEVRPHRAFRRSRWYGRR